MSRENMFAKVVLASKPTNGAPPIITMHWHYPRIIHSEVMTHRLFSRNARSSRAVPVLTMLNEVRNTPFVPWHWGANQKGMQAGEECNAPVFMPLYGPKSILGGDRDREEAWLMARDYAAVTAEAYMEAGYHKQISNRLLEPFAWMDTLVTSTSWSNLLWLRDHKDAEPHFQDLARLVCDAVHFALTEPDLVLSCDGVRRNNELRPGVWHLPYIDDSDLILAGEMLGPITDWEDFKSRRYDLLKKISAARCARISYKPFDGDPSFEREIERYNSLLSSNRIHASPLEHQATPDIPALGHEHPVAGWANEQLGGNLGPGWIQFRKTIPGEYVAG